MRIETKIVFELLIIRLYIQYLSDTGYFLRIVD